VHELWRVLSRVTGQADPESAYQLRLARLADTASAPLHALGLTRLAPAEQRFLERYAERAPVQVLDVDPAGGDAVTRTLAAAWPANEDYAGMRERAREVQATQPGSPIAGRLRIFGAANAEQEAQAVDVTVREWLLAGKRRIGIVVQDRSVARRARALLERARVLVKDEAGWAFSTTSAATVIGRWLDVVGTDCYYRDLLDLMKSPFAFHDWSREGRQSAVWRLEGYVREENVISGLGNFVRLAEQKDDPEVRQMLARIRQGAQALGRGNRSIPRWLAALSASLDEIGVRNALAADTAGEQLLELIARLGQDLTDDTLNLDFAGWRRWLGRQLEAATFRDRAIDSPVVFTGLSATRLRQFDAVLVLGCDAAHLPGPDPVAMFFNQGVRAELQLPTWSERVREMEEQLAALIATSDTVLVTWQRMLGGEKNLLSPTFERLDALHRLAWESGLEDRALAERLLRAEVRTAGAGARIAQTTRPAPHVPSALLPRRISASGYNSLVACPYQFYARYALKLAELDDVQEMVEKKDYGIIVHHVLTVFHRAHARISDFEPGAAERELEKLSDEAFAGVVARNYLAQAWLARWKGLIPAYIAWQCRWESAGWSWKTGEVKRSIEITTPKGETLTLHGRLDRVDERPGGAAVIDYKTRAHKALQESLKIPGEDVQLAAYALLWGDPVAEAMFLSVDRKDVASVGLGRDVRVLAEATRARLAAMFDTLAAGGKLPAQGVEVTCGYCEARGLCRKDHWHE
jgi:ATP-dependent helicase/nuclease subunit B